uniref:Probable protein disulfide-isomerase A4 n=1 Tax=Dermatophagoides pteronyssinus TaxID=6956 RepID=A0A6P6YC35_DERPT|nr:probable protein disulfide-isomerase A4 [Dermatophagoides pteronyssinus]
MKVALLRYIPYLYLLSSIPTAFVAGDAVVDQRNRENGQLNYECINKKVEPDGNVICLDNVHEKSAQEVKINSAIGNGSVEKLTSANFDDFIKSNDNVMVMFMAPWCRHCKHLEPEYAKAAKNLRDENVRFAEVDATIENELANKHEIKGFPTVYMIRKGKKTAYDSGRTAEAITEWVTSFLSPIPKIASSLSQAKAEEAKIVKYILVVHDEKDPLVAEFVNYGENNRAKGIYYQVVDPSEKKALYIVRANSEVEMLTDLKVDTLAALIDRETLPLFGPINGENYPEYAKNSSNWVWFAGANKDYEAVRKAVQTVSKKFRNKFNFVWLDTELFPHHAQSLLSISNPPAFVVTFNDKNYIADFKVVDATEHNITSHIENVVKGEAKRHIKSAPESEKDKGCLRTIVGSNFRKLVFQKQKDVLLLVHVPWCHHCTQFFPIFKDFAKEVCNDKSLMVASIDANDNEIDSDEFKYDGFPAVFFLKAGTKTPIVYHDARTKEALHNYIKKVHVKTDTKQDEL